ncbi:MAG: cytidylate kinase [Gammaproteobacteria bacterium]|jgi:cytidylate kinase|nr:cytidylate kinase [Gammaproteobacteria bacterium]
MKKSQPPLDTIITLDGPAGTGKGTITRLLAKKLGWHYLDSGALFRILAYTALAQQLDLEDDATLSTLATSLEIIFQDGQIFLSGKEITSDIRTETVGEAASKIAVLPGVRTALAEKQREFYQSPGLVADGRDMGTVIFPNAILKFFLDASIQERAKRRQYQLKKSGITVSLGDILRDLKQRDTRDTTRRISPLIPAPDAIIIDTTTLSVDEVFARIIAFSQKKLGHD